MTSGFRVNKPAILYYIKVFTTSGYLYKVGITNRTIVERFHKYEQPLITILKSSKYLSGSEALLKEQMILSKFKEFKYLGPPVLSSGNTELFTKDILNFDT